MFDYTCYIDALLGRLQVQAGTQGHGCLHQTADWQCEGDVYASRQGNPSIHLTSLNVDLLSKYF